jgi:hypothetical protein
MRTVIMIVGYGWALMGAANIVLMPWGTLSEGLATAGLMFNGLLFVLPGLGVGALGQNMRRRRDDGRAPARGQERVEPRPPAR